MKKRMAKAVVEMNAEETRTDYWRLPVSRCFPPDIFDHMPEKKKFSSITLYSELAKKGNHVKAYIADHPFWRDLGTPEAYMDLSIRHTASKILTNLQKSPKTPCHVTPSSHPLAHALNFNEIEKTAIHLLARRWIGSAMVPMPYWQQREF